VIANSIQWYKESTRRSSELDLMCVQQPLLVGDEDGDNDEDSSVVLDDGIMEEQP
jgi:hypothetical protein